MAKRKVLIPLDGSEFSRQIVPVVRNFFEPRDVVLVLMRVAYAPAVSPEVLPADVYVSGVPMAGSYDAYSRAIESGYNSLEQELGSDIVAGVPLDTWSDPSGNNQFAVRNVPGFDQLGGTELSDQFNFIVTYWGTLTHAGGNIALREQNDQVQDALWAWLGDGVGSNNTNDLFLEVHSLAGADLTPDEPSASFAAGSVDFEAMVLRCNDAITKQIDVQVRFGSGAWTLVGNAPTTPLINDSLFPPAL